MNLSSISSSGGFPPISSGTTTTGSPTPEDKSPSSQESKSSLGHPSDHDVRQQETYQNAEFDENNSFDPSTDLEQNPDLDTPTDTFQQIDQNTNLSQNTSPGQNINQRQDLSRNISATQNLTTNSDSGTSDHLDSDQNTSNEDQQVSNTGLKSDQQISSGHNSREGQNNTGSGEHSRQDQKDLLKMGYASHATPSSTTVTSIHKKSTTTSSDPKSTETTTDRYQNSQQLSPAAKSHIANTLEAKAKNLGLDAVIFKVDKKVITTAEDIDTKTLQVDKKIITTAENINSKASTVAFMKNAAPTLKPPPYPNVYAMIMLSQQLSTNTLGLTITAMVAANNGMSLNYAAGLKTQIQDIITAMADNNNTGNKPNPEAAKIFGWVMVAVMYIAAAALIISGVGVVMGAALLATAVMMTVMMTKAGTQLTDGLAYGLQEMGLPKKDCEIVASVLIAVIMIACTLGVSSFADVLLVASEAAVIATEDTAVEATEEATEDALAQSGNALARAENLPSHLTDDLDDGIELTTVSNTAKDTSEAEITNIAPQEEEDAAAKTVVEKIAAATTKDKKLTFAQIRNALSKPEGRAAFNKSITKSFANGFKSTGTSLWNAPSNIGKATWNAVTSVGKATWNAGASLMNTGSDAMTTIREAWNAMTLENASLFFKLMATKTKPLASNPLSVIYKSPSLFQEALTSRAESAAESLKSMLSKVDILNKPGESAYILSQYFGLSIGNGLIGMEAAQTGMRIASDVEDLKAAQKAFQYMQANAAILSSQSTTNSINEQMQLGTTQISEILDSINSNVTAAAGVLGGITSGNPLLDMNTSA